MTRLTVIGSINLDIVATAPRLPLAGETVTGAALARHPGGKGANQALAAARLGATVSLIGRVGADAMADEALASLRAGAVDLTGVRVDRERATGVALIAVDPTGENQIVVAAGANHGMGVGDLPARIEGPLILQLELPVAVVEAAAARAEGFVAVNLAPAAPVSEALLGRADLLIVNEGEAAFYGDALHAGGGRVVVTLGAAGAVMFEKGREVARAAPPRVEVVDATGAGDAFVGAIVVALRERLAPDAALAFACAAGALAATRPGAQPSLPSRAEVEALLLG
ncbi:ribokinase [Brevundimonas aurifodinae]|uniref:Ribokinase n=2 Tax=Brevundimonas TaxID=41275 RepID=A0ABV1NJG2_9CAUL|nr:MAG: ribokinase [Brevundimonas sp. 12-68-7]OYX34734.1 MAG: ribokinase [Brevundimonas subvibrioides]